jgi:hypothetical protein
MEVDDGNLMDALMKAVAKGRPGRVEWSGMEIAAMTTPKPVFQPVLSSDFPERQETDLEIVQVDTEGGAIQLSWSGMETVPVTRRASFQRLSLSQSRPVEPKETELEITEVEVEGGAVQLGFL